jgi:hypothetical protein
MAWNGRARRFFYHMACEKNRSSRCDAERDGLLASACVSMIPLDAVARIAG